MSQFYGQSLVKLVLTLIQSLKGGFCGQYNFAGIQDYHINPYELALVQLAVRLIKVKN